MEVERLKSEFENLNELLSSSNIESEDLAQLKLGFSQLQTIHDTKMHENQDEIKRLQNEMTSKKDAIAELESKLSAQMKEMEKTTPNLNEDVEERIGELEDEILHQESLILKNEKVRAENDKKISSLKQEISDIKAKNAQELSSLEEKLRKLNLDKDQAIARMTKLETKKQTLSKNSQWALSNTESFNKQISVFKQRMNKPNIRSNAQKAKLNTLIHLLTSYIVRFNPEFLDIERGSLNEVSALYDVIRENLRDPKLIEGEVFETTNSMKESFRGIKQLIRKSTCPKSVQRIMTKTLYTASCIKESSQSTIPLFQSLIDSFKDFHFRDRRHQMKRAPSSLSVASAATSREEKSLLSFNKPLSIILIKEADEGKKILKLKDCLTGTMEQIFILKKKEDTNHEQLKSLQSEIQKFQQFCVNKSQSDLAVIKHWQSHVSILSKEAYEQANKLHEVLLLNEECKRRIEHLKKKKEKGLKELAKRDENGLIKIHLYH